MIVLKQAKYMFVFFFVFYFLLVGFSPLIVDISNAESFECEPTRHDILGPFYRPGAPVRSTVGKGYLLKGTVRSASNCDPIEGSRIELWLVGPDGQYNDDYRATVVSDKEGRYSFESNHPSGYVGRPPHIHIMVSTVGYERLITQHYPEKDKSEATFELVLVPVK